MTQDEYRIDSSDEHPTLESLAAYQEGELPLGEADDIRSHLVRCADCASVVLDLSESSELDSDAAPATVEELSDSWKRLREALDEDGTWSSKRIDFVSKESRWKALAVAASLAAVLLGGTSSWLWYQSKTHLLPQVDPPWISLVPEGDLRSSGPAIPQELVLTPGVRGWVSLAFSAPETVAFLQVQFFPRSGISTVWSWSGPRPKDPRVLRMEVTSRELSPGDYRIELDGRSDFDGTWTTIARYHLLVTEREGS